MTSNSEQNTRVIKIGHYYNSNWKNKPSVISQPHLSVVSNIDTIELTSRTRAGVIPYLMSDGVLHFCFGKHRKSGNICDLGGHMKPTDPSIVYTALRELREESHGVFDSVTIKELKSSPCIYNSDSLLIFLPLIDSQDVMSLVTSQFYKSEYNEKEICDLIWINEKTLVPAFYFPVKDVNTNIEGEEIVCTIWEQLREFITCIDSGILMDTLAQVWSG